MKIGKYHICIDFIQFNLTGIASKSIKNELNSIMFLKQKTLFISQSLCYSN